MTEYQSFGNWDDNHGRRLGASRGLGGRHEPQPVVPSVPLRDLLAVLRRHVGLILAITIATLIPVFWFAYLRPASYEARALIRLVDARRAIAGGLATETEQEPIGRFTDELLSYVEVLKGRTVLEEVVDREGLRLVTVGSSIPSPRLSEVWVAAEARQDTVELRYRPDAVVVRRGGDERTAGYGQTIDLGDLRFRLPEQAGEREEELVAVVGRTDAVDYLTEGLRASARTGTDLIDVAFVSRDSLLSQRVVNSLVEAFRDYDLRMARETSIRRVAFLEEQLEQVEAAHAAAQDELSAFRAESQLYFSQGRIGDQQQSLVSLDERWEELAATHRMFGQLLNTITRSTGEEQERALRTLMSSPEVTANPAIAQLYTQLVQYQSQRDELLAGPLGSTSESPDVRRVETLIQGTRAKLLDAARSHHNSLAARLASIDDMRSRSRARAEPLPVLEATENRLQERVASAGRATDQLRAELQQARMAQAVEAGRVQIIDLAPGSEPTRSNGPLKLAIGLVLGLFFGAGGAFAAEATNTSIRRPQELSKVLGVPQLAIIPRIEVGGGSGLRRLAAAVSDRSRPHPDRRNTWLTADAAMRAAEAYRTLRTNLVFTARGEMIRSLVVTSASPGEGKTTTAVNLASSFAQQGYNILIIDADLRSPRLHRVFDVRSSPGLADLLRGEAVLEDVVRPTALQGLHVIPAGVATPASVVELLSLDALQEALAELWRSYDLIVLDTPPVLAAADTAILAADADAVLMVVRAGQTERSAAEEATNQLSFVGARVVGAVLNDPDSELPRYGTYQYPDYSYGGDRQTV